MEQPLLMFQTLLIAPVYLGKLSQQMVFHTLDNSTWRDIKAYNNHAFVVSEASSDHGMQVFDLTRLRDVSNPPEIFDEDAHYQRFWKCQHIVIINEDYRVRLWGWNLKPLMAALIL